MFNDCRGHSFNSIDPGYNLCNREAVEPCFNLTEVAKSVAAAKEFDDP